MSSHFNWEPTLQVMAVAVVLYAMVWGAPLLARQLVEKKTQKILKAVREANVNQKKNSQPHASDQQTT